MGLAPVLVERIFDIIRDINKQGTTILLVEQNANVALEIATRGYVLETDPTASTKPQPAGSAKTRRSAKHTWARFNSQASGFRQQASGHLSFSRPSRPATHHSRGPSPSFLQPLTVIPEKAGIYGCAGSRRPWRGAFSRIPYESS